MTHSAVTESDSIQAITSLLAEYFDGLYFGDLARLQRVFHPRASYICAAPGDYQQLAMPEYWQRVAGRLSPAESGQPRLDRILAIELAGPCAAMARVNCAIGDRFFTDVLSLACIDEQWRIVAKLFDYRMLEPMHGENAAGI